MTGEQGSKGDGPPVFTFDEHADSPKRPGSLIPPHESQAPPSELRSSPNGEVARRPPPPPPLGTRVPRTPWPKPELQNAPKAKPYTSSGRFPEVLRQNKQLALVPAGALVVVLIAIGAFIFRPGDDVQGMPRLYLSDSGELHQIYDGESPNPENLVLDNVKTTVPIHWADGDLSTSEGDLRKEEMVAFDGRYFVNAALKSGDGALVELFEDRRPAEPVFKKSGAIEVVVTESQVGIAASGACYSGHVDELETSRVYRGDYCFVGFGGEIFAYDETDDAGIFSFFDSQGRFAGTLKEEANPRRLFARLGRYFLSTLDGKDGVLVFDIESGETVLDRRNPNQSTVLGLDDRFGFAVQQGANLYIFTRFSDNYASFQLPENIVTRSVERDIAPIAEFTSQGLLATYADVDGTHKVYLWKYGEGEPVEIYSQAEPVFKMATVGDKPIVVTTETVPQDQSIPKYNVQLISDSGAQTVHTGTGFVDLRVVNDWLVITEESADKMRMIFVTEDGSSTFSSLDYEEIWWLTSQNQVAYVVGIYSPLQIPIRVDFERAEATELEPVRSVKGFHAEGDYFFVSDRPPEGASRTYEYGANDYFPRSEVDEYVVMSASPQPPPSEDCRSRDGECDYCEYLSLFLGFSCGW